jgi:beta-lactamase regulating signal transducer with metallopeptidase domain
MLWWLLENSLVAGVLAVVVALLCRVGRFRPAVRHALWLLVLAKLITPPLVEWPWQLPSMTWLAQAEPGSSAEARADSDPALSAEIAIEEAPEMEQPARVEVPLQLAQPDEVAQQTPPQPRLERTIPWWQSPRLASSMLALWLAGSLGMLLVQVIRVVRFRRRVATAKPAPRSLERQVKELAAALRVQRPLTLLLAGIGSPFVWGLGRPKLLWPSSLLECLPAQCRPSVILHELAHLRRRDHWVGWLQMLAECLWWWNPLFWYVRRQLRLNAELACDAWVISTLPRDRRAYAEALIEVTQLVSMTSAPAPAVGMNSSARQVFERRLTMIMRERVPCKVPALGLVAIAFLGLLALPGWSQVKEKPAEQAKKKETKQSTDRTIELRWEAADELDLAVDEQPAGNFRIEFLNKTGQGIANLKDLEIAIEEQSGTDAERSKRLQKLEQQLQTLLKEVQALRTGKPQPVRATSTIRARVPNAANPPGQPLMNLLVRPEPQPRVVRALVQQIPMHVTVVTDGQQVVSLTRATYKLPHGKAEYLASFLSNHMKAKVMETKVEGDSLIVTTSPDAQKAVAGLVALIQGKTTAALDAPKPQAKRELLLEEALQLDTHIVPLLQEGELIHGDVLDALIDLNVGQPKKEQPKKKP